MTTTRERGVRWLLGSVVAGTLLLMSVLPGGTESAEAGHIACGASLSGGIHILDSNVSGCTTPAALTMTGPVTLILGGFTVSCFNTDTHGVEIEGQGAKLLGPGTVTGCDENVVVGGDGQHLITDVTSTNSSDGGFIVTSGYNRLVGNTARNNGDNGFQITGDNNRLTGNIASGIASTEDSEHGFKVDGMYNRLSFNIAQDTNDNGFAVEHGKFNILEGNIASGNKDDGFLIGEAGQGNMLIFNKSLNNGKSNTGDDGGDGYEVEGDENILKFNTALNNRLHGIHLESRDQTDPEETSANNTISLNVIFGSGVVDMLDDNDNCGTNKWILNLFGTRSRNCIH